MTYRTKLGTIPYANVVTGRDLKIGDRFWLPDTIDFKPVKPVWKPRLTNGRVPVVVDRIDGDILFLTRF